MGDFIHNDFSSGFVDYKYTLNVQSLAPPPPVHIPTNYGLFIGVRDEAINTLGIKTTLNDSKTATELANEFAKMPNSTAYLITRDLTIGEGLTKEDISAQLKLISDQIKPGDNLVLYIGSHGGSYTQTLPPGALFYKNTINNSGIGNEYLSLGNNVELGLPGLTDKTLTSLLSQFPKFKDIQKMAFIDACHSGGFWASGDSYESSQYDLNSLNKIALLAASSENNVSYSSSLLDGQTYFGIGLKSAWVANPITGKYFSDGNGDGNITLSELQDYLNGLSWLGFSDLTMFENSFGDVVPFDANLIKFDYKATTDFTGALNVASVPEPQTLALLTIALLLLFSRSTFAKKII